MRVGGSVGAAGPPAPPWRWPWGWGAPWVRVWPKAGPGMFFFPRGFGRFRMDFLGGWWLIDPPPPGPWVGGVSKNSGWVGFGLGGGAGEVNLCCWPCWCADGSTQRWPGLCHVISSCVPQPVVGPPYGTRPVSGNKNTVTFLALPLTNRLVVFIDGFDVCRGCRCPPAVNLNCPARFAGGHPDGRPPIFATLQPSRTPGHFLGFFCTKMSPTRFWHALPYSRLGEGISRFFFCNIQKRIRFLKKQECGNDCTNITLLASAGFVGGRPCVPLDSTGRCPATSCLAAAPTPRPGFGCCCVTPSATRPPRWR